MNVIIYLHSVTMRVLNWSMTSPKIYIYIDKVYFICVKRIVINNVLAVECALLEACQRTDSCVRVRRQIVILSLRGYRQMEFSLMLRQQKSVYPHYQIVILQYNRIPLLLFSVGVTTFLLQNFTLTIVLLYIKPAQSFMHIVNFVASLYAFSFFLKSFLFY